ncbi:MAG TPA: dTDP-4-amino-4,6-dideoxygalactose transaminase [Candidatus Aquilonibacter sp.]|nr:dTDP-4-amino-4,6-dideoxygalactose transaminase [Candidatus Aquilonibacter sp.]
MPSIIPFNRPSVAGNELAYMQDAVRRMHLSGDGHFTKAVHSRLESLLGAPRALMTTSCSHALEMSALLLDVQEGDEVIMPSFTFVSTANAFVLRGARPVFVDIRPDTLNIDEQKIEAAISPRTKAIVVVHYAGVACEMNDIVTIGQRHGIPVVEDNAHGLFGSYHGKLLGTFGVMATQSFHETKNISCGEGGALVINDPHLIERAEITREKGTNRSRFFRGLVDKYTWVAPGSSYLPSDLLAAYLLGQLEKAEEIQSHRMAVWNRYQDTLADWARSNAVAQPIVPDGCAHPAHLYYLLLPSLDDRTAFIAHLKARGIIAVFHYVPLHTSEFGRRFGSASDDLQVTESISDRLVRLPLFNDISAPEQERVIDAVLSFSSQGALV